MINDGYLKFFDPKWSSPAEELPQKSKINLKWRVIDNQKAEGNSVDSKIVLEKSRGLISITMLRSNQ